VNKIEKLIEELCTEGVPRVRLGTATTESSARNVGAKVERVRSVTNTDGLVDTNKFWENSRTSADTSNYKVVKQGMFVYNPSRINVGSIARHTEIDEVIVSPMYVVFQVDETVLSPAYLMHFFSSSLGKNLIDSSTEPGARFRLPFENLAKFMIQIPHLDVQKEIVLILDNFLKLEAELEAELEARQKQYQSVASLTISKFQTADSLEFKLAELAEIYDGTHQTPKYVANGVRFVSVENIDFLEGSNKYISLEAYESDYNVKPVSGDVFMTRIGSVGRATVVKSNEPLAYYVSLALIRPDSSRLDSNFLKHWLSSVTGKSELAKWTLWSATPIKINLGDIGRLRVTVPGIETQKEIGARLDYLEGLFRSSSIGLPAEITARRQQYEYYRNKLLTFKELKAS
jgi:type I restriction enzyme S subunit